MQIQSINYFNQKFQKSDNIQKQNMQHFGLKMQEPLKHDVVSFGVQTPKNIINPKQLAEKVPTRELQKVVNLAETESKKVKTYLETTFGDMKYSLSNQNVVIEDIQVRSKSLESLLEKIRTLGLGGIKTEDIPKNIFDLCGARFVMYNTTTNACNGVIGRFECEVEKGNLILEEIEVKRPAIVKKYKPNSKARAQYDYGDVKALQSLYDTSIHKNPNQFVKLDLDDVSKESNYMAIHLRFRLKNGVLPFELQIMGSDVADYKELDDILYKLLGNKSVNKKYKPIKDIITNLNLYDENFSNQKESLTNLIKALKKAPSKSTEDLIKIKDFEDQLEKMGDSPVEKFNKYRADAFIFQREREPQNYINCYRNRAQLPRSKYVFTNNPELNAKLDLEELYILMKQCDKS